MNNLLESLARTNAFEWQSSVHPKGPTAQEVNMDLVIMGGVNKRGSFLISYPRIWFSLKSSPPINDPLRMQRQRSCVSRMARLGGCG